MTMKPTLTLLTALLLLALSAVHASAQETQIETRRAEYLNWIVENFGKLESTMDPRDGRRWALNHARLVLNRDTVKANSYFESFMPPPRDNDIYLIRFLRTLLDLRDSPRLSDAAEKHIVRFIETWPTSKKHLANRAHWAPGFTENHDLMYLTLGWAPHHKLPEPGYEQSGTPFPQDLLTGPVIGPENLYSPRFFQSLK